MIGPLLLAGAILLVLAILLGILAVVVAIRDGVQAISDNTHRIRADLAHFHHEIHPSNIALTLDAILRIDGVLGDLYRSEKRRRPTEF